jgi:hypothetical protein
MAHYPGTSVSSTNKTDHHDITEILLKLVLDTITQWSINKFFFLNVVSLLILWLPFLSYAMFWTWSIAQGIVFSLILAGGRGNPFLLKI